MERPPCFQPVFAAQQAKIACCAGTSQGGSRGQWFAENVEAACNALKLYLVSVIVWAMDLEANVCSICAFC